MVVLLVAGIEIFVSLAWLMLFFVFRRRKMCRARGSYKSLLSSRRPIAILKIPATASRTQTKSKNALSPITLSPRTGAVSDQKSGLITRMNTH
jgi:hypothetical protein